MTKTGVKPMKIDPKTTTFAHMVVRPIENGYLVEIETENDDLVHAFKNYKETLRFLKGLENKEEPQQ